MKSRSEIVWTEEDIETLICNYGTLSPTECQAILPNFTVSQISAKAARMGLEGIQDRKHRENLELLNFSSPYSCYILGYMWADDCILSKGRGDAQAVNIATTEPNNLRGILQKVSPNWREHTMKHPKQPTWSDCSLFNLGDIRLATTLGALGYGPGDKSSAELILSKIPEEMKRFWLLGLIDGDGCFYYNEKYRLRQFQITSNIEQDWAPIEKLFDSLGVEWSIDRRTTVKLGKKRSNIRVFGRKNLQKLGDYIYSSFLEDGIGMQRKYDKLQECLEVKPINRGPDCTTRRDSHIP